MRSAIARPAATEAGQRNSNKSVRRVMQIARQRSQIIASLTISEKEFLDIKPTYVSQVIDILRTKADNEAKLLFREYTRCGGKKTLVELSKEISHEINEVTDVLLAIVSCRLDADTE
jgi:hypothetical protein